uniref:Uncharacterized protein n=1 Tax=Cacopsylla melanoneura TaxID=428564 RepID=A0A8D9F4R9_9HEMI
MFYLNYQITLNYMISHSSECIIICRTPCVKSSPYNNVRKHGRRLLFVLRMRSVVHAHQLCLVRWTADRVAHVWSAARNADFLRCGETRVAAAAVAVDQFAVTRH